MRNVATIVFDAIYEEKISRVIAYVQGGGNVNLRDETGSTLLHRAVHQGSIDLVAWLLQHGATVNATDGYGNTPLHIACIYGRRDLADLLLRHGADVDSTTDRKDWTPLMVAINENDLDMADWLISQGADLNHVDREQGWTPLLLACEQGLKEMIIKLIDRGGRVDAKVTDGDARGRSAIHLASYYGDIDTVRALIRQGVDIDQQPEGGGLTALHWAVYNVHVDLLEFLLAHGANVNIQASSLYQQRAPLHFAVAARNEHMAQLLLESGADPLLKDSEGQSPVDMALLRYREHGSGIYERLLRLLESYI
ncbi:MAG: hypothetical protein OHK0039_31310 [Bacteroidia bacterium]